MQDVVSTPSRIGRGRLSVFGLRLRSEAPSLTDCGLAVTSAVLLILSFPDFNLWPLAWLGLVPLLVVVARSPQPWQTFLLGWLFGSIFFYGSCYWLTYSMIHFGGIPLLLAYVLLAPGAVLLGIFPGFFTILLSRSIRRWGPTALFVAPIFWCALEWGRLQITGQLWNAVGYSQAYHPLLIQAARWGGVYAVGFWIVLVNSTLAYLFVRRQKRVWVTSAIILLAIGGILLFPATLSKHDSTSVVVSKPDVVVVAVQPNVPMEPVSDPTMTEALITRHTSLSLSALQDWERNGRMDEAPAGSVDGDWPKDEISRRAIPRLVIWPESPMNFAYGGDNHLRERLASFAKTNNTSILLNSQELAPNDGIYNSALLINQDGSLVAQYDKIRLLPFGEYVPLPQWLPGASLISAIVGDFTPGTNYQLMPVGRIRAGVFICIESAYPAVARRFTREGADVLINISNDGYLGPTAVMRQHLANAIFRAVENDRPLLSVTNTGITSFITPRGEAKDLTDGFKADVRTWNIARTQRAQTFYTVHGDLFAGGCAILSLLIFMLSFKVQRKPWLPLLSVITE
ncbi:MAG: apolipoprotein N-acyltransferase [Acidobacteriota bacterium]|nr:apolipoprotein N-acyltransferase [Acidobacteriota bacterium]